MVNTCTAELAPSRAVLADHPACFTCMHAGLTYPEPPSLWITPPHGICTLCGSTVQPRVGYSQRTQGRATTRLAVAANTAPAAAHSQKARRLNHRVAGTACRRGWRRLHSVTRALDQRRGEQPGGGALHDSTERRRRRHTAAEAGGDVRLMLRLTLREAALGAQREVIVRALRRCSACDGVGARPGSRVMCCAVCRGEGQVARFASGSSGAELTLRAFDITRAARTLVAMWLAECRLPMRSQVREFRPARTGI